MGHNWIQRVQPHLGLIADALDAEVDADVRLGLVVARVVVRELHLRGLRREQRDEAQAVRDELVTQARRVLDHLLRVGLALFTHVTLQSKHKLMMASHGPCNHSDVRERAQHTLPRGQWRWWGPRR
jgi:hypothetical protein